MSETIAFKPEVIEQVNKIIARYPEGRQNQLLFLCFILHKKSLADGWMYR